MLSPRTETILKSIVGQYITKAVPVPSRSLVSDYELGVSPATIRHEMAHLEQEGYVIRSHPSAGSIPSDKGYRYYVESLSNIDLPPAEQRLIGHLFYQAEKELDEWLKLAATLIAQLVQNMAIVTTPKPTGCQFKHMELFSLQDSLALVVVVLRGARVKQQLITFEQAISQPRLTAIANKLNAAYSDLTSSQVLTKALELSTIEQQVNDCLLKMLRAEDEQEYEEPYLDGLHFMLNQPEFTHSQQMLELMELVEHRNLLRIIVPQGLANQKVRTVIGKENKSEAIHNCSVVISRYGLPEEAEGTIGIVGPTRMPYAHTVAAVGYLSSVLTKLVAELYGREIPTDMSQV